MRDRVSDHLRVYVRGSGHIAKRAAGVRAPPADTLGFGIGEIGQARSVPQRLDEEVPEVDRVTVASRSGRRAMRDHDKVILGDRPARDQRPPVPVFPAHETVGGLISHAAILAAADLLSRDENAARWLGVRGLPQRVAAVTCWRKDDAAKA